MDLKINIIENMSDLDIEELDIFKPQVIAFSKQIREKVEENIPRILKNISNTLGAYNWNVFIRYCLDINGTDLDYHTRIYVHSIDKEYIKGELVADFPNYLHGFNNSSRSTKKLGSLNFIKKDRLTINLNFFTIEKKDLNYRLILEIPHKDMETRIFKDNNDELDAIDSKIRKFFRILKQEEFKDFWYIWPEILVSDIIVWKLYAFSNNRFGGCNLYFSKKDNTGAECNNSEFLKEILSASQEVDSDADEFDFVSKLCMKLNKTEIIENIKEDMIDEELIETLKYIKLLDY